MKDAQATHESKIIQDLVSYLRHIFLDWGMVEVGGVTGVPLAIPIVKI